MASKKPSICTLHKHPEEGPVEVDLALFTEFALRERGFILRTGGWLTGYYHWNRPHAIVGCGMPTDPDEYGWVEICFAPIGEQAGTNQWAEMNWKRNYPAIYAWYMDDTDMRQFHHGCLLFIKSDVYIHTGETVDVKSYFGRSGR